MTILLSSLLVTAGIAIVSFTLAKYQQNTDASADNTLEEFYAAARLYRTENGSRTEIPLREDEDGLRFYELPIDPSGEGSPLDDLSLDIIYKGKARTYMRFNFDMNWYRVENNTEELILHRYPVYEYDDTLIFNNQEKDNYFYFKDMIDTGTDDEVGFHALTGMTDQGDLPDPVEPGDSADTLRIYVTIDCVQFNRVKTLWNMTRFPWEWSFLPDRRKSQ